MIGRSRNIARRVSRHISLPAPTAGLNAKDPLPAMKPKDAVQMDNYFPLPSSVITRRGSMLQAPMPNDTDLVESLMAYSSGTQQELFACAEGNIYDVTAATTTPPTPVVSGLSNSRLQHTGFGTAGGQFLLFVNGQDKYHIYDGTTWEVDGGGTYTVSEFDTSLAANINVFKNRVWFIQRESMSVWYLPTAAVAGEANELNLGSSFKLGGSLVAMGNWTIDNAAGVDDYAVFITTEGEAALYKGTDPSNVSTWALVGTFRMGRPLGRRCMTKAGADVLVLTTDGAFPMSKALLTDRSQINLSATDRIQRDFNVAAQAYLNNFGWQPIIYPIGQKLIINIPEVEGTTSFQYVMNTEHGAWCRFTNWNATCFETLDNKLFYGRAGAVVQADVGGSDEGVAIEGVVRQAYNYFNLPGTKKHFKLARPIIVSEGSATPVIVMDVDFRDDVQTPPAIISSHVGADWNEAEWDTSSWITGRFISDSWQSLNNIGISGGLKMATATIGQQYEWVSTDIVYEQGNPI